MSMKPILKKLVLIALLSLFTNQVFAVCISRAVDSNTRIISLAKDYAEQADAEFKKRKCYKRV